MSPSFLPPSSGRVPSGSAPGSGSGSGSGARRASASSRRLAPGTGGRVGRFLITGELGRGGMGAVFRGLDPELGRDVAVKVLLPRPGDDTLAAARSRERFLREARITAKLRHPGIVAVHEVGESDGRPFLAMDFVDGETLSSLRERGPLPAESVAELVRGVARALEHAHRAGVLHRDVKPQNVLIDGVTGEPRLVDFGLARQEDAPTEITLTGQLLGTPQYVAPEQARGEKDAVGPAADVYALGGVLYFALTGQPPFEGDNILSLLRQVMTSEPPPPRSIDPTIAVDLATIALRCLEKEPSARYRSAGAVAADLQRFIDGEMIEARRPSSWRRVARTLARHRVALVSIVALGVSAVAGGGVVAARIRSDRAERAAVTRILDRAVGGDLARDDALFALAQQPAPTAAAVLGAALDEVLAELAAPGAEPGPARARALHRRARIACEGLGRLGVVDGAVGPLGRWLAAIDDPGRAAPAGIALCRLGGSEADRHLVAAAERFDPRGPFWEALAPWLAGTGVPERIAAEVAAGLCERAEETLRRAPEEALPSLDLAVQLAPGSGEARRLRGFAHLEAGRVEAAIVDLVRAIELDAGDVEARTTLGEARLLAGEVDAALAELDRAVEHAQRRGSLPARTRARALTWRGIIRYEKRDLEGAITDLSAAIDVDPTDATAWCRRGIARRANEQLAASAADLERAVTIDPSLAKAWLDLGLARYDGGEDWEGTIEALTRAIDLGVRDATAWVARGVARRETGDREGAIADLSAALELDADHRSAWWWRGICHHEGHAWDDAISDLTIAIELGADDPAVWRIRGLSRLMQVQDLDGAISDLSRSIALDPDELEAWRHRGAARLTKGDAVGAIEDLSHVIAAAPDHPTAYDYRGTARRVAGDLAGSLEDLTRAIALDPDAVRPWRERGVTLTELGRLDDALSDLDRALEIDPELAHAWADRARVKRERGDVVGAVRDADRGIRVDGGLGRAWTERALARRAAGDLAGALADAEEAIRRSPSGPHVASARSLLVELGRR